MRRMLVVAAAAACLAHAQEAQPRKVDLKVLYAGEASSARTVEFVKFLGGRFASVGTLDLAALNAEATKGWDVVVVDGPSPYLGKDGFKMPKTPALPPDYARATVLVGAAGGGVLTQIKPSLKLDWL